MKREISINFQRMHSKEEEKKYRQDLKDRMKKGQVATKKPPPPDPTCLYCGVSWFLVLFAFLIYMSLMGVPESFIPTGKGYANDVYTWVSSAWAGSTKSSGPQDIYKTVFVDLADVYLGRKVTFKPGKLKKICPYCGGIGAHHGEADHMHTCDKCDGSGVILEKRELFAGIHTSSEAQCPKCGGRGFTVTKKCSHCDGGYVTRNEELTIKLQKGIAEGTQVTLKGQGHQVLGYSSSDIIVEIISKPHRVFTRDNLDLHVELSITLDEAFKGFKKTITHLDGRKIPITSTEVVNEKTRFRVKNEGLKTNNKAGNLLIRFKIVFPRNIGGKKVRKLRKKLRDNVGKPAMDFNKVKSEL
jgi:DnaJ-class molecular chaperone